MSSKKRMHPLISSNQNDSEIIDMTGNLTSLRKKQHLNQLYFNPVKKINVSNEYKTNNSNNYSKISKPKYSSACNKTKKDGKNYLKKNMYGLSTTKQKDLSKYNYNRYYSTKYSIDNTMFTDSSQKKYNKNSNNKKYKEVVNDKNLIRNIEIPQKLEKSIKVNIKLQKDILNKSKNISNTDIIRNESKNKKIVNLKKQQINNYLYTDRYQYSKEKKITLSAQNKLLRSVTML